MPDPIRKDPDHFVVEPSEFKHTDVILGVTDLYPGAHPPPSQNNDESSQWFARRRAAEARQRVPIAVSPGCRFKLPSGRIVNEGDEIHVHEFDSAPDKFSLLLERLVIIRLNNDQLCRVSCSRNWRFRVAEGQALISRSGIVDALGEITENDLEGGIERIRELITRGILEENPEAK